MKGFIILLATFVVALSNPLKDRNYHIEETRAGDNKQFVWMEDESGKTHLVNLKHEPKDGKIAEISDVSFHLYTRANHDDGFKIEVADFDGTINSTLFDRTRKCVFSFHGWSGTLNSNTNMLTKNGTLFNEDANVFVVDWHRPANEFYTLARKSVPIVAAFASEWINKLMAQNEIPASKIVLVGQSLGGQVIGYVGAAINGQASALVALDPARPLFYIDEPQDCLDPTDGAYVHVIHTNKGFLGFLSSIGHTDYYPNGGGMNQAGCGPDIVGTCAHYRAYYYYGEALLTGGFKATQCGNYEDFKNGKCADNNVSYMGNYQIDTNVFGDYYLDTASESPYALN